MRFKSFAICTGLAPLLIAAAQPVRLQPSSPWVVDYAADSCRLIRNFGEAKSQTKLVFESDAPGEMDMLIIGRPLRTSEEQVQARFLPARGETFDGTVAQAVTNGDPAILWGHARLWPEDLLDQQEKAGEQGKKDPGVRPPAATPAEVEAYKTRPQEFAAATTEIEILTRRDRPVILETGSLGEPMKAFDKCSRDSLKDWGVDPDVEDKIVRPVWALNPAQWLSSTDYPPDMVSRGKESEVNVRLLIDASGKVTNCTSLSHFVEKEFNRITCDAIVKRARFEPAELADGTKVPSYTLRRAIWRMAP